MPRNSQPSITCRIEYLYIQPQFSPSPFVSVNKVIHTAQSAIVHCKGVCELHIHLHDFLTIQSFPNFLKRMWSSLGPRLRRLTINTTWAKLPVLLEHIPSSSVMRLEELSVRLVATESALPRNRRKIYKSIRMLIISHRDTLQILRISSSDDIDLSRFLSKLGHFPRLRKFCVAFNMNSQTFSDSIAFSRFLNIHEETLEYFCI